VLWAIPNPVFDYVKVRNLNASIPVRISGLLKCRNGKR
jgi:hypothetical protein